ncbi:MAG: hypothetical protein H0V54_07305 [Chthoniobacterales bacterium]|nr:hypothetical protein [Chthoniobacterales bacterium]
MARICKLDRRTVSNRLANVPNIPGPKGAHLYALVDALPALCRRDTAEEETSRERLMRAQADIAEHQLLERQRLLFPRELVMRTQGAVFAAIRARILGSHLNDDEKHDIFTELHKDVIAACDAELAHDDN